MKKVKIAALLLALAGAYTAAAADSFTGTYAGAGLGYTSSGDASNVTLNIVGGYAEDIDDKLVALGEASILTGLTSHSTTIGNDLASVTIIN